MPPKRLAYSTLLYSTDPMGSYPKLVTVLDETPEFYLTEPVFGGICEAKRIERYPKALWKRG